MRALCCIERRSRPAPGGLSCVAIMNGRAGRQDEATERTASGRWATGRLARACPVFFAAADRVLKGRFATAFSTALFLVSLLLSQTSRRPSAAILLVDVRPRALVSGFPRYAAALVDFVDVFGLFAPLSGVNRPASRRYLRAIIFGNREGTHDQQPMMFRRGGMKTKPDSRNPSRETAAQFRRMAAEKAGKSPVAIAEIAARGA